MIPKGWRLYSVDDICTLQNGNSFKPEQWDTKGLPIIRIQNLNGNPNFNYFSGEPEDKWLVEPGQLLFAWAGTKGISFGPTIWGGPKGVLNQHIYKVFEKTDIDKNWLYIALKHVTRRIELQAHGFKATLLHVKKKEIDKHPVLTPPLEEQIKITEIVSKWDDAIKTVEKLIENSRAQKKALMQQLLTGKKRYPNHIESRDYFGTKYGDIPIDWGFVAIETIANQVSTKNTGNKQLPVLSCSKHDGFVDSLKYFNKKVFSEDTSNYKIVNRNTFAYPSNHIEEGSIGYQDLYDEGIVSPIYTVFKTNSNVSDGYLYKLLKTDHYRQIFSSSTNASVDRRGSLRWNEFKKIHIPLPGIEEQGLISDTINKAAQEIVNYEVQLTNLKNQKKFLMQQLLTGKRRVNMDDDDD